MNGTDIVKATESAAIALTPETVLAYVNAKATKQEVALFLNQCAMFSLNPFKREIYLIKYKDGEPATFVVGYESYLKRAERTGKWAGLESGTEDDPKTGRPIKAWAKIYRKDWTAPLFHEVYLSEYVQTKTDFKTGETVPTRFWATKPRTMLKKVAIAQAVRMAFPDEFGGMPYTAEEMPIEHEKLPATEIKVEKDGKPKPVAEVHAPKRNRDEFDPEAPVEAVEVDPLDEAHHDTPEKFSEKMADQPGLNPTPSSLKQLEQFAKIKSALADFYITEDILWTGIHRFTQKTFGIQVTELAQFDEAQLTAVLAYMTRWLRASETERKASEGKGKKS